EVGNGLVMTDVLFLILGVVNAHLMTKAQVRSQAIQLNGFGIKPQRGGGLGHASVGETKNRKCQNSEEGEGLAHVELLADSFRKNPEQKSLDAEKLLGRVFLFGAERGRRMTFHNDPIMEHACFL